MKIYYFDEATRELLGEGRADPDPLDPGRFLVPSNATPIEPPEPRAGFVLLFATDFWTHQRRIGA